MADVKFSQFNAGGDCKVGDIVVGLRSGDNAQFTFPGDGFKDASGNFLLEYTTAGVGSVNHVFIKNAATTFAPLITADGGDALVNLDINSKGTPSSVFINGVEIDTGQNISAITTATFVGSSSGQAILQAQATAGTPTLQLPNTSGILALSSAIPSFPLSLANGGTGASLVASNGGIFYSTGTAGAILSGTATSHQVLLSGSSSAPSWSTATYPSTTNINELLYSSSGNVIGGVSASNRSVLVSSTSGVPTWSNSMSDGEVIIGSTFGQPQAATLTAGSGVVITNLPNSITISATAGGGGLVWSVIVGTSQAATAGNGYITSDVAQTIITLPATCSPGDMIAIQGAGSGGWSITANTGQTIHIGASPSSVAGSVASSNQYDSIILVCVVMNTDWSMFGPVSSGFVIS